MHRPRLALTYCWFSGDGVDKQGPSVHAAMLQGAPGLGEHYGTCLGIGHCPSSPQLILSCVRHRSLLLRWHEPLQVLGGGVGNPPRPHSYGGRMHYKKQGFIYWLKSMNLSSKPMNIL
jgi:hypothetical protein